MRSGGAVVTGRAASIAARDVEPDRPPLAGLTGRQLSDTFGRLFDAHARDLHRYLTARIGTTVADDLVAETFLTALRVRGSYDPAHATVRAWLFGIATNLLRHHLRAEQYGLRALARLAPAATPAEDHADRAADRVDAAISVRRLSAAVADLPAGDRDVLLLTSWANLTPAEVAAALGIPAGTVRSRLHRVRRGLRARTAADRTGEAR